MNHSWALKIVENEVNVIKDSGLDHSDTSEDQTGEDMRIDSDPEDCHTEKSK